MERYQGGEIDKKVCMEIFDDRNQTNSTIRLNLQEHQEAVTSMSFTQLRTLGSNPPPLPPPNPKCRISLSFPENVSISKISFSAKSIRVQLVPDMTAPNNRQDLFSIDVLTEVR